MKSRLTLHLPPIPWQRPARTMWGTFNPHQKKLDFVKRLLKELWQEKPQLNGAVSVKVLFVMPIARSLSKKKKAALIDQCHISDPDIDNLLKFTLDALSGLVLKDDCQFAHIESAKIYGEVPKVDIMLTALENREVIDEQLALLSEFEP